MIVAGHAAAVPAAGWGAMIEGVSRRSFLLGAATAGAATAVPLDALLQAARLAAAAGSRYFTAVEYAICDALCAGILPSDAQPGAAEARAVDFIDLFLAAFELPASVADNPAIWLRGPYSGRNPYGDPNTGRPSSSAPPNQLLGGDGVHHFLPLSRRQTVAWRARLYGAEAITGDSTLPAAYRDAVRKGLIPLPAPLRTVYRAGLAAYDDFARSRYGSGVAAATPAQVASLLEASGSTGFGTSTVAAAPGAAKTLYPLLVQHTLQGCLALPEYGGNRNASMWSVVGWDGDTQPLGNSIYDAALSDADLGDRQGHNQGFGDAAVYRPAGGYREFRPVSAADVGAADPAVEQALITLFGLGS